MGDAHQFGGTAEIGPRSRSDDLGDRLAASNQAAGINGFPGLRLDWDRLSGQQRLID